MSSRYTVKSWYNELHWAAANFFLFWKVIMVKSPKLTISPTNPLVVTEWAIYENVTVGSRSMLLHGFRPQAPPKHHMVRVAHAKETLVPRKPPTKWKLRVTSEVQCLFWLVWFSHFLPWTLQPSHSRWMLELFVSASVCKRHHPESATVWHRRKYYGGYISHCA